MSASPISRPRSRVAFTPGSIAGVLTARKRHVCQSHLEPERHYIEPGEQYVADALPPDHPDIGNRGWWHLRVCLDCCPKEFDPRPSPASVAEFVSGEVDAGADPVSPNHGIGAENPNHERTQR